MGYVHAVLVTEPWPPAPAPPSSFAHWFKNGLQWLHIHLKVLGSKRGRKPAQQAPAPEGAEAAVIHIEDDE